MKILATLALVTFLSGCAVVDKVSSIWPRDHDPALVSGWVNLDMALSSANCKEKATIEPAVLVSDWLNRYALFRNDPQKVTTKLINDNLNKAVQTQNEVVCDRYLKLSIINMKTIKDSWSGR